jgi:hypothetical protein
MISAAVFGAIGLGYGLVADVSWLSPIAGLLIGAVCGAGIGWGFSVDNSDNRPRGARKVVYVAVLGVRRDRPHRHALHPLDHVSPAGHDPVTSGCGHGRSMAPEG